MRVPHPQLVDDLKRRYEDLRQSALDKIHRRSYKSLAEICEEARVVVEAKREWQKLADRLAKA